MNYPQRTLRQSIFRWLAAFFSLCVATQVIAVPGDLDTTFDTDGIVTFVPPGSTQQYTSGRAVLTADQKIVVASVCLQGGVTGFCLTRFNTNGSVDTTFGTLGVAFGPTGVDKKNSWCHRARHRSEYSSASDRGHMPTRAQRHGRLLRDTI